MNSESTPSSLSPAQTSLLGTVAECTAHLQDQFQVIEGVAEKIFRSLSEKEGVLHVFGSGHSHILTSELFHRAGGLVPVNPIFIEETMPHRGPKSVRDAERKEGFAKELFGSLDIRSGEVVLVVSNSGINAFPIEFAECCREVGAVTVAITSLTHSKSVPARIGRKLFEVCDLSIDTGVPTGDACVEIKTSDVKVAPVSSIVTALVGELLVARIAEKYAEKGLVPPVLQSANTPGGDDFNKSLEEKYSKRISLLK